MPRLIPSLVFVSLLSACGGGEPATDKSKKPVAGDDTAGTGDDTGELPEETWGPADLRPGAYTMVPSTVTSDTCGGRIVAGTSYEVPAPNVEGYVTLWNYLPLEGSSRQNLRGSGSSVFTAPDGTCEVTETTSVTGRRVSGIKFGLEVTRGINQVGTGCPTPAGSNPCETVWSAAFDFIEPGGGDTATPPPPP